MAVGRRIAHIVSYQPAESSTLGHDPSETVIVGLAFVILRLDTMGVEQRIERRVALLHRYGPARPDRRPEHADERQIGHTVGPVEPDHDVFSTVSDLYLAP